MLRLQIETNLERADTTGRRIGRRLFPAEAEGPGRQRYVDVAQRELGDG